MVLILFVQVLKGLKVLNLSLKILQKPCEMEGHIEHTAILIRAARLTKIIIVDYSLEIVIAIINNYYFEQIYAIV